MKKQSPVHTPSIHGGVFMGASSLGPWEVQRALTTKGISLHIYSLAQII
jgi:hypothetical protein